jgi:dihydrofolate reductase
MSKINIIVAVTNNNVIGKGNDMPWHLPTDLKNFKKITEGSCVVMGRKCWESIPEKFRPLPNRTNVVITRNEKYEAKGAATLGDIDRVLTNFKENGDDDNVFVIGGSQIYKEAFKYADVVYLTQINADIEGDIFLEGFDREEWMPLLKSQEMEENGLKFRFYTYVKKII